MAKTFQVDTGGTLLTGLVSYYKLEDVNSDENGPATPYNESKSKLETYNLLKLNTIFVECKNILIYWEKSKKLEKYDGKKL